MARAASNLLSTPVHKPVSFAVERAFPARLAAGSDAVAGSTRPTSAMARVRDSLVLRVVAKNISIVRSQPDAQRAR
jgi:hypothetical protein